MNRPVCISTCARNMPVTEASRKEVRGTALRIRSLRAEVSVREAVAVCFHLETWTSKGTHDFLQPDRMGKGWTDGPLKSCGLQGKRQLKSMASVCLSHKHVDLGWGLCTPSSLGEVGGRDRSLGGLGLAWQLRLCFKQDGRRGSYLLTSMCVLFYCMCVRTRARTPLLPTHRFLRAMRIRARCAGSFHSGDLGPGMS